MQVPPRKLDLKGNRLPDKFATTADQQDAMEACQAANPLMPVPCDPQCAPAQAQKQKHVCPTCRGYGHVITDVVNGDSKPCPTCTATWNYEPDPEAWESDPPPAMPDPSCAPHPKTGLRPWELKAIHDDAMDTIQSGGIMKNYGIQSAESARQTATEVMQKQKEAQQKYFDDNPDIKKWAEYVKRCIEKGI